jgi:hypothetical protein
MSKMLALGNSSSRLERAIQTYRSQSGADGLISTVPFDVLFFSTPWEAHFLFVLRGGASMLQAQSFYESQAALIWWLVLARIGQGLRERYELAEEMPPKLPALLRKLDDRDWLFPSVSWDKDVDLFLG